MSRKKKGLAYFGVVLCVLLLGVVIVLKTQSERIAINLGTYLTARAGEGRNITIDVGDIGGNLLRDVKLKDFVITYTGSEAPKILFTAKEIHISHNPVSLLFGNVRIDSVGLESPRMVILKRPDGSWVYPYGDSKKAEGGRPPRIEIRKLGVSDGSIVWEGGRPAAVTRLEVEAVYLSFAEEMNFFLNNLSFLYDARTRVERASGYFARDRRATELHLMELRTEKSSFGLSVFLGGEDWDTLDVRAEIDSLALEDALSFYGSSRVGDDFGRVRGIANVGGRKGRYAVDASIEGRIDRWSFEDLTMRGAYEKRKLLIEDLEMTLNDTPMRVTAEYEFKDVPGYRGTVAFTNMDVGTLIRQQIPALDTDMTGEVRFRGEGITEDDFRLHTWPNLQRGRYQHYWFDSVTGEVEVTARDVTVVNSTGQVPHGRAYASGFVAYDGILDLEFGFETENVVGIEDYHGIRGLGGGLVAEATLERKNDYLVFEAHSIGDSITYRSLDCDSLVFDLYLADSEAEGLEAHGQLFGSDIGRGGSRAEELIADFEIEDRHLSVDRLVLTREGGSLLGLVGELDFVDGGFDMVVENIFVEVGRHVWENAAGVNIDYGRDTLSISGLELVSEMGAVSLDRSVFTDGEYDIVARVKQLDLGLFGKSTGRVLPSGILNLLWNASGTADSLGFSLNFNLTEGDIKGVTYDALDGQAIYEGGTLIIDDFILRQGDGSIVLEGEVPVNLAPRDLWGASDPDSARPILHDLGDIRLEARDIDISLLSPIASPLREFAGKTSLIAEISGRRDNIHAVTSGRLDHAYYGEVRLGRVEWDISLEDSLLTVSEFRYGANGENGQVRGTVPVSIEIMPFSLSLLERPIELEVSIKNGNLGLLAEVLPEIRECEGRYDADLRITGLARDPYFEGFVDITDGHIRVEGALQDLRDFALRVAARGKEMQIEAFRAEDGAIRGKGRLTIEGLSLSDYSIELVLDDFRLTEYEDVFLRVSGDLEVSATELEPGRKIPSIEGEVEVHEGEYFFSLVSAQAEEGGFLPPTRSPPWVMNVEVEIPNKFWLRGDDIEAEVQGTVNVKRTIEGLLVLGTLRTIRGEFSIYHNAFKIERGEIRFGDVTSIKKAYINLEAEARVLDEKIEVIVSGFLDNVDVSATSESGWSETQIFEALTLRMVSGPGEEIGQQAFAEALLQSWGMALLNRFGGNVARELRLDRFGIEVGNGATADNIILSTRVTFGKYVTDNIYLQYTESLGNLYGRPEKLTQRGLSEPERRLQAEYRLSDMFTVEGETGTVQGLGYFDVDLRFRYGY